MNTSRPKALLRSLVVSYLLSGILLLALSFILYKLKLKEAQINTAVYAVYVIACFFGGLLAGKAVGSRRFLWGLISGILYFLVLLAASLIMQRGTSPELPRMLTTLACCAVGGTAGGMIS